VETGGKDFIILHKTALVDEVLQPLFIIRLNTKANVQQLHRIYIPNNLSNKVKEKW
jgi:hypothetical protein